MEKGLRNSGVCLKRCFFEDCLMVKIIDFFIFSLLILRFIDMRIKYFRIY